MSSSDPSSRPDSAEREAGQAPGIEAPAGSELARALAAAATHVDQIIGGAHEVAEQIRREAERQAEHYLADRRREADLLVEQQRQRAREVFASLRRELDEAERRAGAQVEPQHEVDLTSEAPGSPPPAERVSAVIRAGQLAAMGRQRGEIEAALRSELGVERPAEIVAAILPD